MAFTVAYMRSLCNLSNVYIVVLVSSPVDKTIVVHRMVSPIRKYHIVSYKNASMYQTHQDTVTIYVIGRGKT